MSSTLAPVAHLKTGTLVYDNSGMLASFIEPGPDSDPRIVRLIAGIGRGEHPGIETVPEAVIPAIHAPKVLPIKDPRITVAKDPAGRPGTWVGPWRAQVPTDANPHWHRTKRDALTDAAWRLVIGDFWEKRLAALAEERLIVRDDPNHIEVLSWVDASASRARFAGTPSYDPEMIPAGYQGAVHIGGGVWRTVCRACPAYTDTYDPMMRYRTIGPHEVDEHGFDVPGLNVGLMATGA